MTMTNPPTSGSSEVGALGASNEAVRLRHDNPYSNANEGEIDVFALLSTLYRYKWLIVSIVVLTTSIGVVAALFKTPVYRAEALLAPVDEEQAGQLSQLAGQFGGLASLAGIQVGGGGGNTDETIATMTSRIFTEEFIRDNELLPILFHERWNPETKSWRVDGNARPPTMADAYKLFNKNVRFVSEDKKTGLVSLAIEWTDRQQAAAWANELVERINARMRRNAIEEAEKSNAYLRKELEHTSVLGLQQAIYRLIEGNIQNISLANIRDEYAFRVIDPAVVPDDRDIVRPKRKAIVVVAAVLGLLVGIFAAFLVNFFREAKIVRNTI